MTDTAPSDERLELLIALVDNLGDAALDYQVRHAELRATSTPTVLDITLTKSCPVTRLADGTLPVTAEASTGAEVVATLKAGRLRSLELLWFRTGEPEWPDLSACAVSAG